MSDIHPALEAEAHPNYDMPLGLSGSDLNFILEVGRELHRARAKFPNNRHTLAALSEEAGETARAMLNHEYGKHGPEEVYIECVQTAVMAIRLATEGDSTFRYANPKAQASAQLSDQASAQAGEP